MAWGYFLIQGVRDPLGGINSLWPLFGIANQLLAAIALCLGTTIILKMSLQTNVANPTPSFQPPHSPTHPPSVQRHIAFALVTLVPLAWLLAVTMTAGVQKIFHPDPRIGFLAQAKVLNEKLPALEQAVTAAEATGNADALQTAIQARRANRMQHFNNVLDAVVAAAFIVLVTAIALLSAREWLLLLARRRLAVLRESEPVWLPDYAIAEVKPLHVASLLALAFALAKELSGEAHLERAQQVSMSDLSDPSAKRHQLYLEATEHRFNGIRRCC
jgi:carbon starvation protein